MVCANKIPPNLIGCFINTKRIEKVIIIKFNIKIQKIV